MLIVVWLVSRTRTDKELMGKRSRRFEDKPELCD